MAISKNIQVKHFIDEGNMAQILEYIKTHFVTIEQYERDMQNLRNELLGLPSKNVIWDPNAAMPESAQSGTSNETQLEIMKMIHDNVGSAREPSTQSEYHSQVDERINNTGRPLYQSNWSDINKSISAAWDDITSKKEE